MINYALVGMKLLHPTQAAILGQFTKAPDPAAAVFSPKQLSALIGEPLGNVSYHMTMLTGIDARSKFKDAPMLELAWTEPRRGAVEHFYALTDAAVVDADIDAAEGEGRR